MDGKSISNYWLLIKGRLPNAWEEGWSSTSELRGPRYWELTIHVGGMRRVSARDPC